MNGKPGKTILIIDDEPWYIEPIEDRLDYEGYGVIKATDAGEGIRLLSQEGNRIKLLITDIMMPTGNIDLGSDEEEETNNYSRTGIKLCRYLRERMRLDATQLPTIFLSVLGEERVKSEALYYSQKYFTKGTVTTNEIFEAVNELIGPPE